MLALSFQSSKQRSHEVNIFPAPTFVRFSAVALKAVKLGVKPDTNRILEHCKSESLATTLLPLHLAKIFGKGKEQIYP